MSENLKIYGYARVSTREQKLEIQVDSIKNYCEFRGLEQIKLFTDTATGKNMDRIGFQDMVDSLENNPLGIDAIVIHKLDRIGRSLIHLLQFIQWLEEKNVGLISITNNIDTTTKEGRLFLYIMGALSEYERELIIERTTAGIVRARERGVKFGRKPKAFPYEDVKRMLALGVPKAEVARRVGLGRSTLYRKLEGHEHEELLKAGISAQEDEENEIE